MPDARPLPFAGARLSRVELGRRHLAPGGGDRRAHASWPCRSAPSSSTGPTCRSTPTPASRWRWPRGSRPAVRASRWRRAVAYGASGEHAGFPGTLLVGHEVLADLLVELVRSARRSFAGVVLVSAHGGNEEALSLLRGALPRPRATTCWSGAPRIAGRRRARRADRDVADAGHRPRRRAARAGRGRVHRAARATCCPVCAPKGCGRYRPTACWVTPRVRAPTRAGRSSTRLVRDLAARRGGALVRPREPGRRRHRRRPRHRRGHGRRAGGCRVAGRGRRPLRRRPGPRLPAGHQGRPRGGGRPPRRRRAHGGRRRAEPRRTCGPRWTRPSRTSGACRPPSPWPASSAAARRCGRRPTPSGTCCSTSTSTACATWRRPPCRRCSTRPQPRQGRFVAVASAAGLLGLRRLSAYSASKHAVIGLVRSLAADLAGTGITANAVCPGSTRGPMLDASAAVYGLRLGRGVRRAPAGGAPARAGGAGGAHRLAVRPGLGRRDRRRAARRRRHDDVVDDRRTRRTAMAECTHLDQIADVEPQTPQGCGACMAIGGTVGPPAAVPVVRRGELLRLVTQPARHGALPPVGPSAHPVLPARRGLDLVLRRRARHGAGLDVREETVTSAGSVAATSRSACRPSAGRGQWCTTPPACTGQGEVGTLCRLSWRRPALRRRGVNTAVTSGC